MRRNEDRPDRPRSFLTRRPPPDYTQRGTKIRLFVLVAALMLVLAMVEQARDPKTWEWLWKFGEVPATSEAPLNNRLPPQPLRTADDPAGTFVSETEKEGPKLESAALDPVQRAWDQGWKDVFNRLSPDQRMLLFEMLHAGTSHAALAPERQQAAADLLGAIGKLWEDYQAVAFQSVAELTGEDQTLWVDVLRQVNGRFNDDVRPGLQAVIDGRTPSESEENSLVAFQKTLVDLTILRIEDDTVFRPAEREIWFHELARVRDADPAALQRQSSGRVAYLQLYKQPQDYRGQVVSIAGTAKLAYRVQAPDNYLGIKQYYVFWVHPAGGPNSPIVVYALEAPPGFPAIKDKDLDRATTKLHEDLKITGVFFKRWAYLGKDGTYTAPLVIANTPEWLPRPSIVRQAQGVPMTPAGLATMLGSGLVLALAIGFVLFRWGRTRSDVVEPSTVASVASLRDATLAPSTEDALRQMEREARGNDRER